MPERARADTASILAVRTRRNGSAYGLFTAAHQALNQTRAVLPATPAVSNTMDHVSTRSLRLGPPSISRSSHGRRDRLAWALNGRHRQEGSKILAPQKLKARTVDGGDRSV